MWQSVPRIKTHANLELQRTSIPRADLVDATTKTVTIVTPDERVRVVLRRCTEDQPLSSSKTKFGALEPLRCARAGLIPCLARRLMIRVPILVVPRWS